MPPSDVATCDSTDAVRRVRALALLLPALAVGGTGIALLIGRRWRRLGTGSLVALVVAGGWVAVLIAVARS